MCLQTLFGESHYQTRMETVSEYHWKTWLLLHDLPVDLKTLQRPLSFTHRLECGRKTHGWHASGISVLNKDGALSGSVPLLWLSNPGCIHQES